MATDFSQYGVLSTGFNKMRLDEVIGSTFSDLEQAWGVTLDRNPNESVIANIIMVVADRVATLFEIGEGVYNSQYPDTASGTSLDLAIAFTGQTRKDDAFSTVTETFYGADNTPIPLGTQVRNINTGDAYQLDSTIIISISAANYISIGNIQVADATLYQITIDGNAYSYTSGTGATLAQILTALVAQASRSGLTVQSTGSGLTVSTEVEATHSFAVSSNMSVLEVGSPGTLTALIDGPLTGAAGDISDVDSTINGLTGASNIAAVIPGRYKETDAEVQAAYADGVFVLGAASVNAIRSNLLAVEGVTSVSVYANTTSATDTEGVPAGNVAAIVEGGADATIAATLQRVVAAGTPTYGTTSVIVNDSEGTAHTVSFSRPAPLYIWVQVTYGIYSEETLPKNISGLVAAAIVSAGQSLRAGEDVIYQRLFGPVYSTTTGIGSLTVKLYANTDSTATPQDADYTEQNIAVSIFQKASFDTSRVAVSG